MQTVTTRSELQSALAPHRAKRIAFVPTMGYLHEGHLTLVDVAKQHGDVVVMSIFVNPLQFGPSEDLARYPRNLERDSQHAAARGVDILFVPKDDEVYEQGRPLITVVPNALGAVLEGHFRPGHFEGVLTVVAKLFNLVQPHVAVFGQKDFQQCVVIERMVADLNMPVEIVIAPTVRESDGLALSSRNTYLTADDRQSALLISRALRIARDLYEKGERSGDAIVKAASAVLALDANIRPQYVELVEPRTLQSAAHASDDSVLAIAAFVGNTRLIDNMSMSV